MVLPFRHLLALSTLRRLALCFGVLTVSVLYAPVAAAIPTIPGEMRDVMGLGCTPSCLLCHTEQTGGEDHMNPYGVSVTGVQGSNGVNQVYGPEGIAYGEDFDEDGVMDADEIIANTDPGSTADTGICLDATYGCGAQVAPGGSTPLASGWGLLAALGVSVALLRQLRRA